MQDGSPQSLYQLAMRRLHEIKTTKQAFIGAQEMQANMQQQQQATQMAAAQPQPGMPMYPGMMPGAPMDPGMAPPQGMPAQSQGMPGQPQDVPPEVYDMIVTIVRQVLQDMSGQPQAAAMPAEAPVGGQVPQPQDSQPQPQGVPPEVYAVVQSAVLQVLQEMGIPGPQQMPEEPPKPKKPKVTPEAFEELQMMVAAIMEHLGMIPGAQPPMEAPMAAPMGAPGAPMGAPGAAPMQDTGVMGAYPGMPADLPPGAQPMVGDPGMVAQASARGSRVDKLAALLRGGK